jgi:2-dehydropantoate 2-reductase
MARILVVGAGAVGSFFGAQLQRAGHDVSFLARQSQAEALTREGLTVHSGGRTALVKVHASGDAGAASQSDLVLVCVKSYDTAAAARQLAPHLSDNVTVLTMQNGVSNHEIFGREAQHPALAAVVYVAAQMESSTHLLHNAAGNLLIGAPRATGLSPRSLAELFTQANIPCATSDFIERDLWHKMIINCAFNGISACTHSTYGSMMQEPLIRELMTAIVREGIAVAGGLDIPLELEKVLVATWKIGDTMHAAYSSTAQDLQRGKQTEIDYLNGHIVEVGRKFGIATPANQAIHALVRLMEARLNA